MSENERVIPKQVLDFWFVGNKKSKEDYTDFFKETFHLYTNSKVDFPDDKQQSTISMADCSYDIDIGTDKLKVDAKTDDAIKFENYKIEKYFALSKRTTCTPLVASYLLAFVFDENEFKIAKEIDPPLPNPSP